MREAQVDTCAEQSGSNGHADEVDEKRVVIKRIDFHQDPTNVADAFWCCCPINARAMPGHPIINMRSLDYAPSNNRPPFQETLLLSRKRVLNLLG